MRTAEWSGTERTPLCPQEPAPGAVCLLRRSASRRRERRRIYHWWVESKVRRGSHVLVHSAIFPFSAILRSAISHLWQCAEEAPRTANSEAADSTAVPGMGGDSSRGNSLRSGATAARHPGAHRESRDQLEGLASSASRHPRITKW